MAFRFAAPPVCRLSYLLVLLWAILGLGILQAQKAPETANQAPYHLSTGTRLVLTDVTVTDDQGQRVPGLKASDFLITDNHQPQKLASFTEHTPELAPVLSDRSATDPGTFNNSVFLHPPPVLNIILIDITNLEIVQQLYLNYQLTRLFSSMPAGQPVAIYWVRRSNAILLQNFTADHGLLLAALHKALPRFPPTGREYYSSVNTLHQLATNLAQLPGRKNVLWFSGGAASLVSPIGGFANLSAEEDAALHVVYDELESSRITVYPFDARGLSTSTSSYLFAQQNLMRETAENTGGHAFVNTNGLQLEAAQLIASDGAYYTLSYDPAGFKPDGTWHKVEISLAPPYSALHLSYRRGYFADDPSQPRFARALTARKSASEDALDRQSPPILFSVQPVLVGASLPALTPANITLPLTSSKPAHGALLYTLRYRLPLDAFTIQQTGAQPTARLGLAALAFNSYGSVATHRAEQITLSLNPRKLPLISGDTVTVDQQISLPKGDTTLFCAVWDIATRRLGTLQVPLVITPGAH